jgi:hypothetical protein
MASGMVREDRPIVLGGGGRCSWVVHDGARGLETHNLGVNLGVDNSTVLERLVIGAALKSSLRAARGVNTYVRISI